jgi:hypothetical protein
MQAATIIQIIAILVLAIGLGGAFAFRFFASPSDRKERFRGLNFILISIVGIGGTVIPSLSISYERELHVSFQFGKTDSLNSLPPHLYIFITAFVVTLFTCIVIFAKAEYRRQLAAIPIDLHLQVPTFYSFLTSGFKGFAANIQHLKTPTPSPVYLPQDNNSSLNQAVPTFSASVSTHSEAQQPSPDSTRVEIPESHVPTGDASDAIRIVEATDRVSSFAPPSKEQRMNLRIASLYRDNDFNYAINVHLEEAVTRLVEKEGQWTVSDQNDHLDNICFKLVSFVGNSRFSIRIHDPESNCMVVRHTSHPEQRSGAIKVEDDNTIQFSLDNNFAAILHSDYPNVHQETAPNPRRRLWDNYVCKALMAYPDSPRLPFLSLCFDVIGEEADCKLRYLKEIGYFDRLGATLNTCFKYFSRLPLTGNQLNLDNNTIRANEEKEQTDVASH